jgi:hypothetical protein
MKIIPLPEKSDKKGDSERRSARSKASVETVLQSIDQQIHDWGLEIVRFNTDDPKKIEWKVVRR